MMQSDMERIAALDFEPHLKCEAGDCAENATTAIQCRYCRRTVLLVCGPDAVRAKMQAPNWKHSTCCPWCKFVTPAGMNPVRFEVIA